MSDNLRRYRAILTMWTEPRATFEGQFYRVQDAVCAPKPVQQPHPPVWIGGVSESILSLAARYANGVNIGDKPSPSRYQERLDTLRAACERLGRDFHTMRKSHFTGITIAPDRQSLHALLEGIAREHGVDVEKVKASLRSFIGTPEEVSEFLQWYVEIGVEQFILVFPYGHEEASLRLIADRVLPRL